MPKIRKEQKFFDFSDYGRSPAVFLSSLLTQTGVTPIHVTLVFGVIGVLSAWAIIQNFYLLAAVGLILKSIVDAMDGELARLKKRPSYSGRYLDSIFDSVLNMLFIAAIAYETNSSWTLAISSYICIQIQGTLYSYYYVILRHRSEGGDRTSQIFERSPPTAFPIEKQRTVNILFRIFQFLYLPFDLLLYYLDSGAYKIRMIPNWYMTLISIFGLGSQLMIMSIFLSLGYIDYILSFFVVYTALALLFVLIRKLFIR